MSTPHTFYLVTLPGLEDLVVDELREWYPDLRATSAHGGVSVETTMDRGLGLNRTLKIPTRVLVRVATFRCRDFPKLFRKVAELNWSPFVKRGLGVEVHASVRASRLKIKSRIEETCAKGWAAAHGRAPEDAARVGLFVRIVEDECVLSLDTSGERLHKRGVRTLVGEAPLRETIAAALIRMTAKHAPHFANEIVDPMVGSGTFLIEAADLRTVGARDALPGLSGTAEVPNPPAGDPPKRLIGLERDGDTLAAARKNLHGTAAVRLVSGDVFDATPLPAAEGARWLFVNPPYGERLKIDGPKPEYYAKLFAATERWARPDLACVLLPSAGVKGRLTLPSGWKVLEKRPFVNGGLPVVAFVFGRTT